ncbi:hypothetical protein [Streptomyces sp. NBC_01361]|uniref:hypothetical protein n=1 Tax=Streptomyces sp. NBC_01361 TaxID=2903838 RepID=UPI002E2FC1C0|nr:hypothetical protein [Streptomyces sp. NBC_01361]
MSANGPTPDEAAEERRPGISGLLLAVGNVIALVTGAKGGELWPASRFPPALAWRADDDSPLPKTPRRRSHKKKQ